MAPRATYRLQLHQGFPFAEAARLAPYLARLGVSHIYASPIQTARKGSPHGYDVVDHARINPELGGEEGFRQMAASFRKEGLGIILDIVPNHMAVGHADNRLWLDLLRHGRSSRYAAYFDVDWAALDDKLLAPFLGGDVRECLQRGELTLASDPTLGEYAFCYFEHRFPLRPEDQNSVHADPAAYRDPASLLALLERQHFLLAPWREAATRINWRRFFDITELAALRIEEPEAFETVHALPLRLYAEGWIDGLRIDHIDGLADPAAYCRKLRHRLSVLEPQRPAGSMPGPAYLVIEKILGINQTLPPDWPVDGTTGYDFMNEVSALLHAPEGAEPLAALWREISGRSLDFEEEEKAARREMLEGTFASQHAACARAFAAAAGNRIAAKAFAEALRSLLVRSHAYRTWATGEASSPAPGKAFASAVAAARADGRGSDALDRIAQIMSVADGAPATIEAVRRFNQLATPVTAKAVEDTAFYRYGRLLSRNDVGSDPRFLSLSVELFHERCRMRAETMPHTMLATSTHDAKRGEDARARLAILSEIPTLWRETVSRWYALNARWRPDGLAAEDEYMLYQTLIGAWPDPPEIPDGSFLTRLLGWRQKSLREAKLRSSWTSPSESYEALNRDFVTALLDPTRGAEFRADIAGFITEIDAAARLNSLVQAILRCTVPGVPDLYQGAELADRSLVDPDNRRPVDFAAREAALSAPSASGFAAQKQRLIAALLGLRTRHPDLFACGEYRPLRASGRRADHIVGFERARHGMRLAIIVPRCCATPLLGKAAIAIPADWWDDTALESEATANGRMRDALDPAEEIAMAARLPVAQLLAARPYRILIADGPQSTVESGAPRPA